MPPLIIFLKKKINFVLYKEKKICSLYNYKGKEH